MIDLKKAKTGDLVWWVKWEIARSGRRLNVLPHPEQYEIREFDPAWRLVKIGKPGESYYVTARIGDLYYTEEEAWEEYNKDIYETIDMLTSNYESSVKYLKSKLHDKSGES